MNWEVISPILNGSGIFLNFLAGFMLAPELIGLKRLKKLEDILEESIPIFRQLINTQRVGWSSLNAVLVKGGFDLIGVIRYYVTAVISTALIILGVYLFFSPQNEWKYSGQLFVLFGIFLLLINISIRIKLVLRVYQIVLSRILDIEKFKSFISNNNMFLRILQLFSFLLIILSTLLLPILPSLTLLYLIEKPVSTVLNILERLIGYLVSKLEGNEGLRALIVATGIFFYILGNALQLIAIF